MSDFDTNYLSDEERAALWERCKELEARLPRGTLSPERKARLMAARCFTEEEERTGIPILSPEGKILAYRYVEDSGKRQRGSSDT